MDRSRLLLWLFIVLAILAATLMSAMFGVSPRGDLESSRLYFAAGVLAFLAFIFVFAMLIYAFGGDGATTADSPGKVIFDSCVKVLPPIATLIIGFYFGAYHTSSRPPAAPAVAPAPPAPAAAPAPKAAPTPPAPQAPAAKDAAAKAGP
jgi:hypothetical protein